MDVFITGASGFIGSAITSALVTRGHRVRGLARSDASAAKVRACGGEPVRGTLFDIDVLAHEAGVGHGVVHTAATSGADRPATDAAAVNAMLSAMNGGAFITTSGAPRTRSSRVPVTEDDVVDLEGWPTYSARLVTRPLCPCGHGASRRPARHTGHWPAFWRWMRRSTRRSCAHWDGRRGRERRSEASVDRCAIPRRAIGHTGSTTAGNSRREAKQPSIFEVQGPEWPRPGVARSCRDTGPWSARTPPPRDRDRANAPSRETSSTRHRRCLPERSRQEGRLVRLVQSYQAPGRSSSGIADLQGSWRRRAARDPRSKTSARRARSPWAGVRCGSRHRG